MRLRKSVVDGPGVRRLRRGRGFSYIPTAADRGDSVDAETLQRIEALVIPPAWKKVWVCPYPNGHIQAVGTDVAGRRQYIYHEQWQAERSEEKYDRAVSLAKHICPTGACTSSPTCVATGWDAIGCWRWHSI